MKWLPLLLLPLTLSAQEPLCFDESPAERLFRDLQTVAEIQQQIHDRLPLVINYQLQGGYFAMPSARTFDAGAMGFGFAYAPPYHIWSLGFHFLPDFAIGWNDFIGTCRFESFYVAATKEFLSWNFEATLGWGNGRMRGFYGAAAWTPFRKYRSFFKNLTLAAEYDANNYKRHLHEHPDGRKVRAPINAGLQFTLWDLIRLSGSTLRGETLAASIALNYDLGSSKGLLPKTKDPAPYSAPVDTQPIGTLRSRQELAQELAFAFQEQGFDLYSLYLIPGPSGKDSLWMKIVNVRYREEEDVRSRIEYILAALTPSNISAITAVTEADGVPIHEYRFRLEDLKRYAAGRLGEDEFRIIAPPQEASRRPRAYDSALLYQRRKKIWILTFRPWFRSFLGSSRGKFKYEVGLALNPEGYLFDEIYYNICGTYTAASSTSVN